MRLIVHPGIGDISWVLSKLSTTGRKFDLVIAEDKKTQRSMPLVDMVDCVNSATYGGFDIYYYLSKAGNAMFTEYEQAQKEGKTLYMTANNWVEKGKRLEGYLPDLDTDFHYTLHTEDDDDWAEEIVSRYPSTFGIYTCSIPGIESWKAWSHFEWVDFIRQVNWDFPDTVFFLLGAKWDQDMRFPVVRYLKEFDIPYVDLIGRTTLPRVTALLKRLDYFAGYASGLTILSNVVNKPVAMLYPRYLTKLMDSWPCPVSLADGSYQGLVWDRPLTIYNKLKPYIERYVGK